MGDFLDAADFQQGGSRLWLPSFSNPASSGKAVILTCADFSGLLSRAPRLRHFAHPSCGSFTSFFASKARIQRPMVPIHGQNEVDKRQSVRAISNCAVLFTPPFSGLFDALLALLSRSWRVARVFLTPFLLCVYEG